MQRPEAKNPPERPLLSAETGNVENRLQDPRRNGLFSIDDGLRGSGRLDGGVRSLMRTGLQRRNREFSENFRPEQAFGETSGCAHPKFARDSNQLHHRPGTFLLFRKTGDLSAATGGPKSAFRLFKPEAKLSVRAAQETSAGATTGLPLLALSLWMACGGPR